ncbi:MAG: DUF4340 domain-containing protein [Spirochaetia bacterium]|nr:DUF4340 domain-containing protein [Spirochaetia bacterium]
MSFAKNKNTILAAACAVLFVIGFFSNDPFGLFEYSFKKAPLMLKNINSNDIKKIEVKQGDMTRLVFESANENWSVKAPETPVPFNADSKKIKDGIEEILKIKKYHEVSSSKEKHAEYEVTADKFHIVLFSSTGKILADLFVGKSGAAFGSSLVRLASDDAVYTAKGNFKGQWNQNIDSFRDKKIVNFVKENIVSVEFHGAKSYKMVKTPQNAWELTTRKNTKPADASKVNSILNMIVSLEGDSFHQMEGNKKPYAKMTITLSSGTQEEIFISGPMKNDEFFMKSLYMQGSDWMSVPKYRVDSLLREASYFEQTAKAPSVQDSGMPSNNGQAPSRR